LSEGAIENAPILAEGAAVEYTGAMLPERIARPTGFLKPCLPSQSKLPPTGEAWLHEIKIDSYSPGRAAPCGRSRQWRCS